MKMIIDILKSLDKLISGTLKYIIICFFILLTILLTATILQRYILLVTYLWPYIILFLTCWVISGAIVLWSKHKNLNKTFQIFNNVCFVLLTALLIFMVLIKYIPLASLLWSEEIIILLFDYMVFLGAAALWINREHISAGDWISGKLIKEERHRHLYRILIELLGLTFAAVLCYFSLFFMLSSISTGAVTNVMAMPKWYYYICMPVAGGLMVIYSIRNIVVEAGAAFGPEKKSKKV
jgi:TRAP-type C4-dicarboxylate transport system permease small subunit